MGERKLLFLMNAEQAREFSRLVQAAQAGDGAAACRLGNMARGGLGGLRFSPREAHRWYARSAMAGDANGQNNLGACYEHGLGCVQSFAKAVKWYRLSVAQDLGIASMNLGYCYLRGHGVSADKGEALRLFRLAVEQGEPKAQHEVERLQSSVTSGRTPKGFKDRTEGQFGCPECWPDAADAAWEARRQLERSRELVDESHFHVMILTCRDCEQAFLSVFTELIDYGGDDSQGWTLMPLTAEEAQRLSGLPEDAIERAMYEFGADRRSLRRIHPRGMTAGCAWGRGIVRLPHD